MQPLRNYLQRCPQKWLLKKIKTPYKWRFVAGNIIYKWRMCFFSVAMFDVRRVSSKVGCSSFKTGMGCQSFTSWESSSLHRLYSRSKERIGYRISPSQWAKNLQILEIKMADLSTSAVQHALNSSDMFWIFQVGFHMWWTLQMWWTLKCLKKHPKKTPCNTQQSPSWQLLHLDTRCRSRYRFKGRAPSSGSCASCFDRDGMRRYVDDIHQRDHGSGP